MLILLSGLREFVKALVIMAGSAEKPGSVLRGLTPFSASLVDPVEALQNARRLVLKQQSVILVGHFGWRRDPL